MWGGNTSWVVISCVWTLCCGTLPGSPDTACSGTGFWLTQRSRLSAWRGGEEHESQCLDGKVWYGTAKCTV